MNGDWAGWLIGLVDGAFMGFYSQTRRNARRLTRLGIALLPLMMLLVGSCKTSQVSDNFLGQTKTAQFRAALFPDRVTAQGTDYHPASGYVSRAQKFVEGDPNALSRLTEQEIGYLFGKPSMERKDADARIWQYKASGCVVDFFFYDDKNAKNASPVSYIDYRLKADLEPGSAPRSEPVTAHSQSKCLRKIATGDFPTFGG